MALVLLYMQLHYRAMPAVVEAVEADIKMGLSSQRHLQVDLRLGFYGFGISRARRMGKNRVIIHINFSKYFAIWWIVDDDAGCCIVDDCR